VTAAYVVHNLRHREMSECPRCKASIRYDTGIRADFDLWMIWDDVEERDQLIALLKGESHSPTRTGRP